MSRLFAYWLGILVFAVSLAAGVFRSVTVHQGLPKVGVEYSSELHDALDNNGYVPTVPWIQSAVQIDLDNDTVARDLLEAARQAGDIDSAVLALEKLVRLRPEDADLRCDLVSGLLTQQRVIEALSHAEVAIRLAPESSIAYANLGTTYLALGRMGESATAYRPALKYDSNNESAIRALAFPLRDY